MNLYAVDYIDSDKRTVSIYILADSYVDALTKLEKQIIQGKLLRITIQRLGNKVII